MMGLTLLSTGKLFVIDPVGIVSVREITHGLTEIHTSGPRVVLVDYVTESPDIILAMMEVEK